MDKPSKEPMRPKKNRRKKSKKPRAVAARKEAVKALLASLAAPK